MTGRTAGRGVAFDCPRRPRGLSFEGKQTMSKSKPTKLPATPRYDKALADLEADPQISKTAADGERWKRAQAEGAEAAAPFGRGIEALITTCQREGRGMTEDEKFDFDRWKYEAAEVRREAFERHGFEYREPDDEAAPKYMPPQWFKDEFGIAAERLRKARRDGRIRAEKCHKRWRYSATDAQRVWPNDVTYLPDGPV